MLRFVGLILLLFLFFMAAETWGLLAKSQIDPETIEEAIARLITAHNAAEESHLAVGQSLQSHKASVIIDHLASSIVEDKIGDGEVTIEKLTSEKEILISAFESLDCWQHNISGPSEIGSLIVQTSSTINTQKYMLSTRSGGSGLDWTKDFIYQTSLHITYNTSQLIHFGVGGTEYSEGTSGAGFKIEDGTLYAGFIEGEPCDYTENWTEITGITLIGTHVFRIIYDQSAGTLKFYVDGILKLTKSSGLPTIAADESFHYQIKNTVAENRYIVLYDLLSSKPR
jgi:hypothetical protein